MKTRAAYLRAPWETEIREVAIDDVPREGWVRLRVDAGGVSGSDVKDAAQAATA